MRSFYYHFAAGYGTIWFVLWISALITQSSIKTGGFGFFGFPVIALCYALLATRMENRKTTAHEEPNDEKKLAGLEEKINQVKNEMILRNPESSLL